MTRKEIRRASVVATAIANDQPVAARAVARDQDDATIEHVKEVEALGKPVRTGDPSAKEAARWASALGPTSRSILGRVKRGAGSV